MGGGFRKWLCHRSTVCVLTSCASAAVWVESFLSSSDIMWKKKHIQTCDFHAQQYNKMYTSVNISISSIATGMWTYGISLFRIQHNGLKKINICIWLLQPQRKKASCKKGNAHREENLYFRDAAAAPPPLCIPVSHNICHLSMNSQRSRARGGGARRLPPDQMAAGAPPVTAPAH